MEESHVLTVAVTALRCADSAAVGAISNHSLLQRAHQEEKAAMASCSKFKYFNTSRWWH